MEHYTLARKTIKKVEKIKNKQILKTSAKSFENEKYLNGRSSTTIILRQGNSLQNPIILEEPTPSFLRDPKDYLKIPEIPIYEPTAEEFREPVALINKLKNLGYEKYGIVKLVAPVEWDPEFALNLQDKKINTRKQVLQDLTKGKCFKQNVNSYTLGEYEKFANTFAKNHQRKSSFDFKDSYRADEFDYWSLIEDPQFKRDTVAVEYAADLPSMRYGSAFPTLFRGKGAETAQVDDERVHPFNLNNLIHTKDSLFQIIAKRTDYISGITSPWVYSGMLFATFCWHVEDLYMYSINYMHKGSAKTWYCVPESHKEDLERVIKEKYCELFIENPELMYNITLTMNPLELVKKNVPVYRTEQKPREFIITFPRVYHAGFSHGYNISEAVNIAIPHWIPFAKLAMRDYAQEGFLKKGSFPLEWLIIENVKRINELNFSQEARAEIAKAFREIAEKELKERDTVKLCYNKVSTKHFDDITSRYDANLCSICKNYTYLSYLSCMVCKRKSCTQHITVCDCLNSRVILNARFSEQELREFSKKLNNALEC